MDKLITIDKLDIQNKILTIRGQQIMLDKDLAELYQVENRALKQAIKRNIDKFPDDFMFVLTDSEIDFMVSQNVIPSRQHLGGAKPFVFTEQGVSMLSSVLKSKIATKISIDIFRAFVQMRKFISQNATIFQRLDSLEEKQFLTDTKIDKVLSAIEDKSIKPKQGIFYNGEVFDAYMFVSDLVKSATKSIILIDNYVDESVLTLFSKNQNIRCDDLLPKYLQTTQARLKKVQCPIPCL